MSQHTPWMVKQRGGVVYSDYNGNLIVIDTRQFYIASIHADADEKEGTEYEEQLANARLIAACPDMASYVISKALEGDADAEKIARSFGWIPA